MLMTPRIAFLLLIIASGCGDLQMEKTTHPIQTPSEKASLFPPPPVRTTITNLLGPESVLHDPEQDVYFISNLNGGLLDQDNNGFISRVDARTLAVNRRWVAGGTGGVHLDAPKGMAIAGDLLYVADVTAIKRFDRRSGQPRGEIALPGATLINDLTTDGRNVYASDTAIKPSAGVEFAATGTDAVWKVSGERAEKIASGEHLKQPNGLDFFDGQLWIVSFRGSELYRLDGGRKASVRNLPRGQLDGLIHLQDGTPIVASWMGTAIYRGSAGRFTALLTGVMTPADIGYDAGRKRLLVPRSALNQVTIHSLQ